jgi:predicted acylesterase/phospholipase RssA
MSNETSSPCRVLSLDGGGAKGFYTLGVLREIEALWQSFDLIFGTSTGSIIAALLALGKCWFTQLVLCALVVSRGSALDSDGPRWIRTNLVRATGSNVLSFPWLFRTHLRRPCGVRPACSDRGFR